MNTEQIVMVAPSTLLPHPKNTSIYGSVERDTIADITSLLADAKDLETIIVSQHTGYIISGHRRVRAAVSLGFEAVPVQYRTYETDYEELEALLTFNMQRDKTIEARVREGMVWHDIERVNAQERQRESGRQYGRGGTNGKVHSNLNEPYGENGNTFDIIAKRIKLATGSYFKARKVVEHADKLTIQGLTEEAYGLLYVLNNQSIDAAYQCLKGNDTVVLRALRKIAQDGKTFEEAQQVVVEEVRKEQEAARKAAEEQRFAEEQARKAKAAQERAMREAEEQERLAKVAQERAKQQQHDREAKEEAARLSRLAQEAEERAWKEQEALEKSEREAKEKERLAQEAKDRAERVAQQAQKTAVKPKKIDVRNEIKEAKIDIAKENETTQDYKETDTIKCIYHGDARHWIDTLPDGQVALLLTDPPYGVHFQSNRRVVSEKAPLIANDGNIQEALDVLHTTLAKAYNKLKNDAVILCFSSQRYEPEFRKTIIDTGYIYRATYIWYKPNHGSGDLNGTHAPQHECIIHAVKGNPKLQGERPSSVLRGNTFLDSDHPTKKPIDLLQLLIETHTRTGDTVIDPFAGSGSTVVAALSVQRQVYACELDKKYHNDICNAIATTTQKMELL